MDFSPFRPSKKTIDILRRDARVASPSLTRDYPYVYKKASGCYIWDVDGKKYMDFAAGVAVMNVGHSNPAVFAAIKKQMASGAHCEYCDFYAETPVTFSEEFLATIGKPFERVFLSNSGTEAVEAAFKLARWHSQKKWTIAFKGAFHGRTMGSLSMTNSKPAQRARYGPFLPVKHVPYPYAYRMKMEPEECSNFCLSAIDRTMRRLDGDVASLFIEPMQGEGGYVVPPRGFVKGVKKLCSEHGALLCDDEIQAGCFRTGKFLAISNFGVTPDIVSMSKALGGGIPIGVTTASAKIMDWKPGTHGNTFGGNLLACAAGVAVLRYAKKKRLAANAVRMGNIIMKRLNEMKDRYECVGDVRGLGLMIGAEIVQDKKSRRYGVAEREFILNEACRNGVVFIGAGRSVIRFCPPLTITKQQAEHGMDVLEAAIKKLHHEKPKLRTNEASHHSFT
jgi:4-aminobutyrate aminotransferase